MRTLTRILIGLLYVLAAFFPMGIYFFTTELPPTKPLPLPLSLLVPTIKGEYVGAPLAFIHLFLGKVLVVVAVLLLFFTLFRLHKKISDTRLVFFSAVLTFVVWLLQMFVFEDNSYYNWMRETYKPLSVPDMEGQNPIPMLALFLAWILSTAYVTTRVISTRFQKKSPETVTKAKKIILGALVLWQLSGLFLYYPAIRFANVDKSAIKQGEMISHRLLVPWLGQIPICSYVPDFLDKNGNSVKGGGGGSADGSRFNVFAEDVPVGETVDYVIEVKCGLIPSMDIRYPSFTLFNTVIKRKTYAVVAGESPSAEWESEQFIESLISD